MKFDVLKAFVSGLVKPSWLAVFVAGGLMVILVLLALRIDEEFLSIHMAEYLPRDPIDFYAVASFDAIKMQHSARRTPALVLVGASASNESYLESTAIEKRLAQAGLEMEVFRLTTPRQTLWESHAMIDKIPKDRPAIIVLGLGTTRFTWTKQELRQKIKWPDIGFRSSIIDSEARAIGIEPQPLTNIYVVDNSTFLLPRTVRGVVRYIFDQPMQIVRFPHSVDMVGEQDEAERRFQERGINVRLSGYERKFDQNIEFLQRIVDHVAGNPEWRIVIVEHPFNPGLLDTVLGFDRYEEFVRRMKDFTKDRKIPFWRIHREAQLTPEDYHDTVHLNNDPARERCTNILIQNLITSLDSEA